ncbi:MAG TPA: hypothetical protein VFS43_19795 [Polyangiaceae bacterium]|nr:hypothetical protein [Polyangiaceae bacterium]
MRAFARAGLLFTAPWALGCYSTSAVPQGALPQRGLSRSVVLIASDGDKVKLDPNSRVRLLRRDGLYTPWVSASDLYVDSAGVIVRDGGRSEGLAWAEVRGAEVENLDGGATAVVVVGVAVLIAAVVVVTLSGKGGQGPSLGGSGTARSLDGAARLADAAGRVSEAASGAAEPNEPPATASSFGDDLGPGRARPGAEPIFDRGARRRASVRVTGAVDAARSLAERGQVQAGAVGALRLWDFVEVGGGGRVMGDAEGPPGAYRAVAFGRLGVHGELDARRRLALPFSVDLGAGRLGAYARLNWGLRVRVYDEVSVGLYPFNPSFDRAESRRRPWSFPSCVETSFAF